MSTTKIVLPLAITLILASCNSSDSSSDDTNIVIGNSFALSGRISATSNTATDDDINDVQSPELSTNNTVGTAQFIPNPVILGGYVNEPGEGSSGRSYTHGDVDDYFQTDLRAGQIINLFVTNENLEGNDLDLGLRDKDGKIIDASVGDTVTETITVPTDGHYFLQVQANKGASNYILSIGQDVTASSHHSRLSDKFAPGEVIVQLSSTGVKQAQGFLNSLGMKTQSTDTNRRMLFTLDPNQSRTLAADDMNFATEELQLKYETLMTIKQLRRRIDVAEASPNYQFEKLTTPNDNLYRYQWDYALMNLPTAWDITKGDPTVTVAVIDTGVLLDHPDLKDKTFEGYDFIQNISISIDGDGLDSNPNDPGDQSPGGSSFHGSHVAGTIAAATNNGRGIAGVGWLTKVIPIRVLGRGGAGLDYDIEQAIRYAAGLPNNSGKVPSKIADVINLSLGGPAISEGFQTLMNEVRRAGVMVVAAAGNESVDTPVFPAALDGVIAVGAVDMNKELASYSNFGNYLDVVAPGGDDTPDLNGDGMPDGILSTVGNEVGTGSRKQKIEFTFASSSGTSMASPHVAGVIALMKAVNPNLTPQGFDDLLKNGSLTEDLGTRGRDDEFGYGLLNAQKAVLAAIELNDNPPPPAPALLVVNPGSLNFGISRSSAKLTLTNGGSDELVIHNITEDSDGFLSIEGQGLGDYIVKVDRNRLSTVGTYTATITIKTNANTVQVPVILQISDSDVTGDAGYHYILLIDPDTLETIQEIDASPTKGVYYYQFNNVPNGTYIIAAGSDFNNDGYICDVGEACGSYLTLDNPTSINVNSQNHGELNFTTGFNVSFMPKAASATTVPVPSRGFARLKHGHELAP